MTFFGGNFRLKLYIELNNFLFFAAGCVLIELFTDGSVHPFSFSQLLAYRAGEYEPTKVLDKIEDEQIKV